MHALKKTVLGGVALLATLLSAQAQVNTVPQVGLITGTLNKATYRAVSIGLAPASSATDIFCISGSATKMVKVTGLNIYGTAGTLVTVPAVILRRAVVDTGGTAASTIANPANTIGKSDNNNPTATATLIAYTANPTIVDASPTYVAAANATFTVTSAGTSAVNTQFTFGANLPQFTQQLVLRGIAEQVCLNLQAATISSGLLNITISWTEE